MSNLVCCLAHIHTGNLQAVQAKVLEPVAGIHTQTHQQATLFQSEGAFSMYAIPQSCMLLVVCVDSVMLCVVMP